MSLSFSIVIFAFLSPIYQCVAIALYSERLQKGPALWMGIILTLGLWLHTQPLFVPCFERQGKPTLVGLRSPAKPTELKNYVLLYGSGLRVRNWSLPALGILQ